MKRKGSEKNFNEVDNFERKQKKHLGKRDKSSKRRLTIYDEFDNDELDVYSSDYDNVNDNDAIEY